MINMDVVVQFPCLIAYCEKFSLLEHYLGLVGNNSASWYNLTDKNYSTIFHCCEIGDVGGIQIKYTDKRC